MFERNALFLFVPFQPETSPPDPTVEIQQPLSELYSVTLTFGELVACHWPGHPPPLDEAIVHNVYPVHWSLSPVRKLIRDQRT